MKGDKGEGGMALPNMPSHSLIDEEFTGTLLGFDDYVSKSRLALLFTAAWGID